MGNSLVYIMPPAFQGYALVVTRFDICTKVGNCKALRIPGDRMD